MTSRPSLIAGAEVRRDADFALYGNYVVSLNGEVVGIIYRDPESKWWYENVAGKHYSECFLGFTKKEAVERLVRRLK